MNKDTIDSQIHEHHHNNHHQREHQHVHHYEFPFPHHHLDAYYVSLEMVKASKILSAKIPRGYRNLADQLSRASASVVLNLCEGANRFSPGEKRQCFRRAHTHSGHKWRMW